METGVQITLIICITIVIVIYLLGSIDSDSNNTSKKNDKK
jgi:hypothetical protein